MINTPPSERPPPPPPTTSSNLAPHGPYSVCRPRPILTNDIGYGNERQSYYREDSSTPNTPRNLEDFQLGSMLPAASAAAALAQLHNHKLENDWESEGVRHSHSRSSMQSPSLTIWQDWMSDTEARKQAMRSSIELPPLHHAHANNIEPTSDPFSHLNPHRRRELLPSILNTSPPGRSSTLPPIQRHPSTNRPRKPSVSKRAREPQHKRQKSRGENAHLRRMSYDRKAYSAEPSSALSAAYGKRWEDLIDAATSATEDVNEDRTPVSGSQSNYLCSELTNSRFLHHLYQQALTPPSNLPDAPEPFPSVESAESGDVFNIESRGLSDSSPSFSSQSIQIYCAACQGVALLKESFACTECICGICPACVDVLVAEQGARRKCPRCATVGGRFKPFQLDIR